MRMAMVAETQELIRREKLALELIDVLDFNFQWLLRFCERNNIEIPDRERLYLSLNKVRRLMGQLSPENSHRDDFDPNFREGNRTGKQEVYNPEKIGGVQLTINTVKQRVKQK